MNFIQSLVSLITRKCFSNNSTAWWSRRVGGTTYYYTGDNAAKIFQGFKEHENEAEFLYDINEVSQKEFGQVLSDIQVARQDFCNFLQL